MDCLQTITQKRPKIQGGLPKPKKAILNTQVPTILFLF